MGFFKQRKNKQFNYKSRLEREQQDIGREDFESKWREARGSVKRKGNIIRSLPVLILLFIMVLILMYILEGYIKE